MVLIELGFFLGPKAVLPSACFLGDFFDPFCGFFLLSYYYLILECYYSICILFCSISYLLISYSFLLFSYCSYCIFLSLASSSSFCFCSSIFRSVGMGEVVCLFFIHGGILPVFPAAG